ncbi:MAG: hypothetical protein BMS9Abin22_081 [Gammaproteobacteria bacterium]|nr:MAG: hypothetical protein BMS9Abin22_081 [Gammaproteobacteria bacterium]
MCRDAQIQDCAGARLVRGQRMEQLPRMGAMEINVLTLIDPPPPPPLPQGWELIEVPYTF